MKPKPLRGTRIAIRLLGMGYFTPKKILNAALNLGRGYFFRSAEVSPHPSVLVLENTSACNLACPGCGFQMRVQDGDVPRVHMSFEAFQRIIDEAADYALGLFFYVGGEPFLRKDAYRMIRYATERKIPVIASTNGSYHIDDFGDKIVDSGLDTLIVTISGATQDVYERYHVGGDLDKALASAKSVAEAKARRGARTPTLVLRYVLFDYNRHQVEAARRLALSVGADAFDLRPDEALVWREKGEIQPRRREQSPVRFPGRRPGDPALLGLLQNYCWWPWSVMVIRADGQVLPCCYDHFELPTLGDVGKEGVAGVWTGAAYRAFRRAMLADRAGLGACGQCNQGMVLHRPAKTESARLRLPVLR